MNKLNHFYNKYIGYEIYPASFKDSNNDGIGDLNGIISKLPYIKSLSVDLIWVCPIYKSPMDDNGYDVSDFYSINPMFGTLDDAKKLITEAHNNGLKIIFDLVLNQTSSEHEWFKKACKDVNCKEHGYYIFKKGKIDQNGKRLPPNNWKGFFNTSCWEYVPEIDEYFFHIFSKKMPDLNYENPVLRDEMKKVAKYWLDLGVDGFRLDAIAHLAKDTTFENSTFPEDSNGLAFDMYKYSNRDRLFDYLKEFSQDVFSKYNAITIGEVGGGVSTERSLLFSGYENGSISMVFNFDTCWENGLYDSLYKEDKDIKTNVVNLKKLFLKWYNKCYPYADMPIYWNNHDQPRCLSQYGSVDFRKESGKMLCNTLYFMYGVPFILDGDEIGMSNVDYTSVEDFNDVEDINFRLANPTIPSNLLLRNSLRTSRMNARAPFNWSNSLYAGFSSVKPYIKNVSYYPVCNQEDEDKDSDSILNFYRMAGKLRHEPKILNSILNYPFALVEPENDKIFAYTHIGSDCSIEVISNFTKETVSFAKHFKTKSVLLHNYQNILETNLNYTLRPFETYLIEIDNV